MKTKYILIGLMALLAIGCSKPKEPDLKETMNDPAKRKELYKLILENRKHTQELVKEMMEKTYCRGMVARHGIFARIVCLSPIMDSLVKHDAAVAASVSAALIKKMQTDTASCRAICREMKEVPFFEKWIKDDKPKKK